jgi:hypothetical protein
MSTFGKKAFNYWNYNSLDTKRWNGTPKDFQMALLQKWYPIGMKCHSLFKLNGEFQTNFTITWEVSGYTEMIYGWVLTIKEDGSEYMHDKHPLLVAQTKEDIRNKKIEKLI